jgi:integrase
VATKRRANNEGTIYQRKDGRWVCAITLASGERKTYYGPTRRAVQQHLTDALKNVKDGVPLPTGNQSVAQFLASWLETVEPSLRPRTFERYEQMLRLHVVPTLGKLPVSQLAPQHVQQLYARLLDSGLSPTTVHHVHTLLHRALQQANRWGLVARNVTTLVDAPRDAHHEMQTLSPEQSRQLIEAARGHRLEALFVLALTTGMRRGELLGLRWQQVDLEGGSLEVLTSLQRTREGFLFAEPKTAYSRRRVSLPEIAVEALRRHRIEQNKERFAAGEWDDHDLVFPNEAGRPLEAGNMLRRAYWPLLKKAGLPKMPFHALRHTAATLLLRKGVHPKIVQEMLGHSGIAITLDLYSHAVPTLQREATAAMDALLAGVH